MNHHHETLLQKLKKQNNETKYLKQLLNKQSM
jgi:hypothetical protein